jgi:tripartite-type tricarboxylate transporter receptor subunit TctC
MNVQTMSTRRTLLGAALSAAAVGLARPALAAYPDRPIRWLVGYPPGGSTDAIARLIGPIMSSRLGQPVVVENRAGANSSIAAETLARSPADGYTMSSADPGTLIINPLIYQRVGYDPERDFRHVGLQARINFILAVKAGSPIRSFADYLAAAKRSPGALSYATPSSGSPLHLAMELLQREAGITLNHVPYRGMGPALNDAAAGNVDSIISDYGSALGLIQGNMIRPVVVFSAQRLAGLPAVPTIAEAGQPTVTVGMWHGLVMPRGTPDEAVNRMAQLLDEATAQPAVLARFAELGFDRAPAGPEAFVAQYQADRDRWQPLVRSLGLRAE